MIAVFDTNIVIDALSGVSEADAEYSRFAFLTNYGDYHRAFIDKRSDP